jgi:hypothetical protein
MSTHEADGLALDEVDPVVAVVVVAVVAAANTLNGNSKSFAVV